MLQILGIVFVGIVFALILKKDKPEITIFLVLFLCIYIALKIMGVFGDILQEMKDLTVYLEDYSYFFSLLIKMIGLTYLCELAAGICKDYGYSSIGNQIEIMGKLLIIAVGIPIFRAIMEMIESVLKV